MKVPSSLDVVEQLMSEIAIDRSLRWLIVPRSGTRLNACADSVEWDDETPGCDRTSLEMLMTPCVANEEEEKAQMEEERQCVESCCVVNHKSSARRLINRASQRVSRWKEMRLSVCTTHCVVSAHTENERWTTMATYSLDNDWDTSRTTETLTVLRTMTLSIET